MDVAGGEHLAETVVRHVAREADVGEARRRTLQFRASRAIAVDEDGEVGSASGGLDEQLQGLRVPDVAGIEEHGFVADAELAAVGGEAIGRPQQRRVDEVGNGANAMAPGGRDLAEDVRRQVVRQDGDGVGTAVAQALEPGRRRDDLAIREGAGLDGGVGKDVLHVEHERGAVAPRHQAPGDAHRQRRRHGDHRVVPAEPPSSGEAAPAGEK